MNDFTLKTRERREIEEAMATFLAKGGKIKRIGKLTVDMLEKQWRNALPSGLKARIRRQKAKKK
jgi:hypothetical protein